MTPGSDRVRFDRGLILDMIASAHAVQVQPSRSTQVVRIDAGQQLSFGTGNVGSLQPLAPDAQAWTRGMLVSAQHVTDESAERLHRYIQRRIENPEHDRGDQQHFRERHDE